MDKTFNPSGQATDAITFVFPANRMAGKPSYRDLAIKWLDENNYAWSSPDTTSYGLQTKLRVKNMSPDTVQAVVNGISAAVGGMYSITTPIYKHLGAEPKK